MSEDAHWEKVTRPMPSGHQWKCSAGHNLFIADRGAVRFEFPEKWITKPDAEGTIGLHDRTPPDDDCALRVSILRLPPVAAVELDRALPLDGLVQASVARDGRGTQWDGVLHRVTRPDVQIVWAHMTFTDPESKRAARSRLCLSRARGIQPLITMDYWDDQAKVYEPVWDHVIKTLRVAAPVDVSGESSN